MNLTGKILGVAALGVAFVSSGVAQTATNTDSGLLGKRYVEAGFAYVDVNHQDDAIYGLGASVNLPVAANVDLNVGYAYSWAEGFGSIYSNGVNVSAVGYLTEGAFRPFAVAGLGYAWNSEALGDDDYALWNAGLGVEYSFCSTTAVRVSGDYQEGFDKDYNEGAFSGTVGVNHWFTDSVGATLSATWIEYGDVGYAATVVFKF